MRKFLTILFVVMAVLMVASPVYAQGGTTTTSNWGVPVGVGLGMGLAAGLAGLGQGRVAGSVAEALARNPGARAGIQLALFIGLAFIESLVLFTFVLLFLRSA
ncbi:MAG TPA: ATP synthase F0 subunit C [Candidatus Angelobacter sp.]|nr:ATP synthase F0 subunit C [Candidatus Angelobacter sp.]